MTQPAKPLSANRRLLIAITRWFDNQSIEHPNDEGHRQIDWPRSIPFILMHVAALAVFWVGISPVAVIIAVGLYALRMFAITGFYHRYFSHKAFRTSRLVQFVFAMVGASGGRPITAIIMSMPMMLMMFTLPFSMVFSGVMSGGFSAELTSTPAVSWSRTGYVFQNSASSTDLTQSFRLFSPSAFMGWVPGYRSSALIGAQMAHNCWSGGSSFRPWLFTMQRSLSIP